MAPLWIRQLFRLRRPASPSHPALARPQLRQLEDRTVPTVVNLTTVDSFGFINGARFQQTDPQSTGTGVIDPIVRMQAHGTEQGYNTSHRPVQFDEKTDPNFTTDIKRNSIPTRTIDGVTYREFLLDINETLPGTLLSLDELRIYQSPTALVTGNPNASYDPTTKKLGGAAPIWDMDNPTGPDGDVDNWIKLNYELNHGSGSGDMFAYIPNSLFTGNGNPFIYLYSNFGTNIGSDAGFEEWAVLVNGGNPKFSISGLKFEDALGNGIQDLTDPGYAGWTINLYKETNNTAGLQTGPGGDNFVTSTATGAGGAYSFTNLADNTTYYVQEAVDPDWEQTYGGNLGNDHYTIYLNSDVTAIDFGNFERVDIFGGVDFMKFEDHNGNGVQDPGDQGLEGWTIELFRESGVTPGFQESEDGLAYSDTTDANGFYSIVGIMPGTYYVREEGQGGWTQTLPADNGYYTFTALSGTTPDPMTFGNFELIDICGMKFLDCDADGVKDEGEHGVFNISIDLYLESNGEPGLQVGFDTLVEHTTTADDGSYCFLDNGPGMYYVAETVPVGWIQTAPPSGIHTIEVALSGEHVNDLDFGNVQLGAGGGHTPGFWSNQNGEAQMNDGGTLDPELDLLEANNLKLDGADFDPQTYAELEDFLLGTNAVNMSNMLSRHLAAMILNVEAGPDAGFVDGEALIYAPGIGNTGVGNNFITINDLIDLANAELALHPSAFEGDAWHAYQEMLKNALDAANNNQNFVQC